MTQTLRNRIISKNKTITLNKLLPTFEKNNPYTVLPPYRYNALDPTLKDRPN